MFHGQDLRINLKGKKQLTRLHSMKLVFSHTISPMLSCNHQLYYQNYFRLESKTSKNRPGRPTLESHTLLLYVSAMVTESVSFLLSII